MPDQTNLSKRQQLLERWVAGRFPQHISPATPLGRLPEGMKAPLALAQEQVWRRAKAVKRVPSFYNESITIHRNGDLKQDALQGSFAEIIRPHEIWNDFS